jgi:hypothetical protein
MVPKTSKMVIMLNYAKIGAIINFNMGDCKAETVETAIYATVPVP